MLRKICSVVLSAEYRILSVSATARFFTLCMTFWIPNCSWRLYSLSLHFYGVFSAKGCKMR